MSSCRRISETLALHTGHDQTEPQVCKPAYLARPSASLWMTSTPLEFDATDHRHWAVREDGKRRAAARWCLNLCSLFSCAAVLPKCVCKCRTRSFSDCVWRTDFAVLPRPPPAAAAGGESADLAGFTLTPGMPCRASIGIAHEGRSWPPSVSKSMGVQVDRSNAICRTLCGGVVAGQR